MTESWRTALARLSEIQRRRPLTEREEWLWYDAQRKRFAELSRARTPNHENRGGR